MHQPYSVSSREAWLLLGGFAALLGPFGPFLCAETASSSANPASHAGGGVNAADLYRQAMGLCAQLTGEEKDILAGRVSEPDAAKVDALHAKLQPMMAILRSARNADYTDWGPVATTIEGDAARGTALGGLPSLSRITHWEASYRFKSDPAGAVDDVVTQEAIARSDISDTSGLIIQSGIHMSAIRLLEQNAPTVPSSAKTDIAYIVDPAALAQVFRKGVTGDASNLAIELKAYADPARRGGSYLQKLITADHDVVDPGPKSVMSQMQWIASVEQALPATFGQSQAGFRAWWNQAAADAAPMPLAADVLKALAQVVWRERVVAVEAAMLNAALALEWKDQARFNAIMDPSTGKAFTCTRTGGGFELSSPMLNPFIRSNSGPMVHDPTEGGEPMTLTVSVPGAN
jgi:hypothetical protein